MADARWPQTGCAVALWRGSRRRGKPQGDSSKILPTSQALDIPFSDDEPADLRPEPGTAFEAVRARAPDGGEWTVRLYRTEGGDTCIDVMPVQPNERTGAGSGGSCGRVGPHLPVLVGVATQGSSGAAGPPPVAVTGIADEHVRSLVVTAPGTARELEPGEGGAFLTMLDGAVDPASVRIEATFEDGSQANVWP